jgi:hypothetical protein
MHDPQTVAFDIKYPWFVHKPWPKRQRENAGLDGGKYAWRQLNALERIGRSQSWPDGYRETFATIWHVDPEKDGSDDSCGWSNIKLTKGQKAILKNAAWWEGQYPHFLCVEGKEWDGTVADAESLERGLRLLVCRVLKIKMSWDDICRSAAEAVHVRTGGKFGDSFCFLPGYHTNHLNISKDDRADHLYGILCGVARNLLTDKRPKWRHPRWHFWHWKIQIHPLLSFKRWAFSRCCKCGKGFSFGYAPVSNNWNGTGPRWFRSETDVYHSDCNHPTSNCMANSQSKESQHEEKTLD